MSVNTAVVNKSSSKKVKLSPSKRKETEETMDKSMEPQTDHESSSEESESDAEEVPSDKEDVAMQSSMSPEKHPREIAVKRVIEDSSDDERRNFSDEENVQKDTNQNIELANMVEYH
jgi:hypothetical protein